MDTLLIGLGIVGATALLSGGLLFGIKPQPVTDPAANLGIPDSDLKETFGIWRFRRSRWVGRSILVRFRSLILIIFWLCASAAAAAVLAGVVALFIGLAVSKSLG